MDNMSLHIPQNSESNQNSEYPPILLVDDRPDNLMILKALFSDDHYTVVTATSGREALTEILKTDFAAILLDVQMPQMDGFETALLIRGREKSKQVPILFVTAVYRDEVHISQAYHIGAADYITKPFNPAALRAKVASYVALYLQNKTELATLEQESQEQFRTLAETIPHLVWTTLPDGKAQYFNHRWVEFTGLDLVSSQDWGWTRAIHPNDLSKTLELWKTSLKTGDPFSTEYRLKKEKEGTYRWQLAQAKPIKNLTGKITRWFGTCTDIDERKKLVNRLEAERDIRNHFVELLIHDLRTPLATAKMSAQLILRYPDRVELRMGLLARIDGSIDRASKVIQDLIDVNRIQSGEPLSLEIAEVDIAWATKNALKKLSVNFGDRFFLQDLRDPIKTKDEKIFLCTRGFLRVIENLGGYSAKRLPPQAPIFLNLKQEHDQLQVQMGYKELLPQEQSDTLRELFQPGALVEGIGKKDWKIEMALAQAIVEAHGGQIQLESQPKKGTTFTITLPRDARPYLIENKAA